MPRIKQPEQNCLGGKLSLSTSFWAYMSLFHCQFLTYSISKELPTLGTVALPWVSGQRTSISSWRKQLPQAVSLSTRCPGWLTLPPPAYHCPLSPKRSHSIIATMPPLVPGKPTWCSKMLCNTKWLLPLLLLNSGNSSKITFHLMLASVYSGYGFFFFFFPFNMKQTISVTIHVWGSFMSLECEIKIMFLWFL